MENKIKLLKTRYNNIIARGNAIKSQGVLRKLKRQIRNLEKLY